MKIFLKKIAPAKLRLQKICLCFLRASCCVWANEDDRLLDNIEFEPFEDPEPTMPQF